MTRWILNSAVVTAFGAYTYEPLTTAAAREWLLAGVCVSRVGYSQTAAYLHALSGMDIPLSREPSVMAPGDEALVCRLRYRVQNPATKGQPTPEDWELGLLRRAHARSRVPAPVRERQPGGDG